MVSDLVKKSIGEASRRDQISTCQLESKCKHSICCLAPLRGAYADDVSSVSLFLGLLALNDFHDSVERQCTLKNTFDASPTSIWYNKCPLPQPFPFTGHATLVPCHEALELRDDSVIRIHELLSRFVKLTAELPNF